MFLSLLGSIESFQGRWEPLFDVSPVASPVWGFAQAAKAFWCWPSCSLGAGFLQENQAWSFSAHCSHRALAGRAPGTYSRGWRCRHLPCWARERPGGYWRGWAGVSPRVPMAVRRTVPGCPGDPAPPAPTVQDGYAPLCLAPGSLGCLLQFLCCPLSWPRKPPCRFRWALELDAVRFFPFSPS